MTDSNSGEQQELRFYTTQSVEAYDGGYFRRNYGQFKLPYVEDGKPGFRPPQIAAAQAVAAHFYARTEPAIVTMPTGSGKTAVLLAIAFLLRAKRVLAVSPSRLVREQIAEQFQTLSLLKEIGALSHEAELPRVASVKKRIRSAEEWNAFRRADVVVATVYCVSPAMPGVPPTPRGLFDLILIDEAHHVAAKTWSDLLDLSGPSRQVLVTATPYRNDEKEIRGKFVFSYSMHRAFHDGVFGDIAFCPVDVETGDDEDVSLAIAAEKRYKDDRAQGLDHRLLIRTDSIFRVNELLTIYRANTSLEIEAVHSKHGLKHARGVLEKLRQGSLDGVVCVDMLGEGFDLPQLKIAAVHRPHRSLAVTLQFIGRFARTVGENVGGATFLAVPTEEIQIEAERLYQAGTAWNEVITRLAGARIDAEIETKVVLDSFSEVGLPSANELEDLGLYALRPYFHVKVVRILDTDKVNLCAIPNFSSGLEVVVSRYSAEYDVAVYVIRQISKVPWDTSSRIVDTRHELFLVHFSKLTGHLFICASRRQEMLYSQVESSVLGGRYRTLEPAELNRALNGLSHSEFFHVGLRNRSAYSRTESYRTVSGPRADRAIVKADGLLYDRGHCFGKAQNERGQSITIGLSTSSKIWSNCSRRIPSLITWCDDLAKRLAGERIEMTGSGLDFLAVGEVVAEIPKGISVMGWSADDYIEPPSVGWDEGMHGTKHASLLDLDVAVHSHEQEILLVLSHEGTKIGKLTFRINRHPYFEMSGNSMLIVETAAGEAVGLHDHLNDRMPTFYTRNLGRLEGRTLYSPPASVERFDDSVVIEIDWNAHNVDVREEKETKLKGFVPIFQFMKEWLVQQGCDVVIFDDGTGEVADFVTISASEGEVITKMYHCKAAEGAVCPGDRVADVYEVCAQAVKSSIWAEPAIMYRKLSQRFERGSELLRGTLQDVERVFGLQNRFRHRFQAIVVQPGVGKQPKEKLAAILASTNMYLIRGGMEPLEILGSVSRG